MKKRKVKKELLKFIKKIISGKYEFCYDKKRKKKLKKEIEKFLENDKNLTQEKKEDLYNFSESIFKILDKQKKQG